MSVSVSACVYVSFFAFRHCSSLVTHSVVMTMSGIEGMLAIGYLTVKIFNKITTEATYQINAGNESVGLSKVHSSNL